MLLTRRQPELRWQLEVTDFPPPRPARGGASVGGPPWHSPPASRCDLQSEPGPATMTATAGAGPPTARTRPVRPSPRALTGRLPGMEVTVTETRRRARRDTAGPRPPCPGPACLDLPQSLSPDGDSGWQCSVPGRGWPVTPWAPAAAWGLHNHFIDLIMIWNVGTSSTSTLRYLSLH